MDLFARKIIAWTLSDTMEVSTVLETINKAKAYRKTDLPLIIHTDRGSQYVSNVWREATEKMQRSYSHTGYPYDKRVHRILSFSYQERMVKPVQYSQLQPRLPADFRIH